MFSRHIAANAINILIVLCVILSVFLIVGEKLFYTAGPLTSDVTFHVKPNDRISSSKDKKGVAERLVDIDAISNATIFRIKARYLKKDNMLKIGEYKIPAKASMKQILDIVNSGVGLSRSVTFPEGFTSFQIVERLNAVDELTGTIAKLPREGSLLPNTYAYSRDATRQSILNQMNVERIKFIDKAWEKRAKNLPFKTKEEAIILASIVERETGISSERRKVAAVFVNRLRKKMKLQTDPTVIYGITKGERKLGRGLRRSELLKKTDYNTYIIPALPSGAICNPGKAAIEATLNPASHDYLYFVADGTGGHVFSTTLKEHNVNVAKWRRIERANKK